MNSPPGKLQWGRVRSDAERERSKRKKKGQNSFNGAASDRTRKAVDAKAAQSEAERLQWGRVRSDAERDDPTCARLRESVLQWGRVRSDAERPALMDPTSHLKVLQWGRVRSDAESSAIAVAAGAGTACFNGAASDRTRKERNW